MFRILVGILLAATIVAPEATALTWEQLAPLSDKLGVAAPFAGVSDGALIVAGGANFPNGFPWEGGKKVWHDTAYVLDTPTGQWRVVGKLPRPLAYGVSVTTKDGLVCIGGSDADRYYADVFLLNSKLEVTTLPSLPRPLANACGALVGNTIYVAGGEESPSATNTLKTFFAFTNNRWQELPSWPGCGRTLAVAGELDGEFYLIGGVDLVAGKRRYLCGAYRYRPKSGWRRIADLPHPIAAAPSPAVVRGRTLLIPGGDDGSRYGFQPVEKHPGFSRDVLRYDARDRTWSVAGKSDLARATVPVVFWRGRYVLTSGEERPGVRSPEVWTVK
jgi:N-acetylneuraminate epimerase